MKGARSTGVHMAPSVSTPGNWFSKHKYRMHRCSLNELARSLLPEKRSNAIQVALTKEELSELRELKRNSLYDLEQDDQVLSSRPWRNLPKYFTQAFISSLALAKMTVHAKLGGSIEVMGMLTGKVTNNAIVVMDVYSLPVEGTETRVNAQSEAYEYMVQYLDLLKSIGRSENIVGWYHSHPGYGCWLSGIDVATQSLNQNFQDPYLAIVVDPTQTLNQGKVEIGAFRTFPVRFTPEKSSTKAVEKVDIKLKSKKQDFGIHADQYYPLEVKLFKSPRDEELVDAILNKSWVSNLLRSNSMAADYKRKLTQKVEQLLLPKREASFRAESKDIARFNSLFEVLVAKANRAQEYSGENERSDDGSVQPEGNSADDNEADDDDDDDDDDDAEEEAEEEADEEDNANADADQAGTGRERGDGKGKKRVLRTSSVESKLSLYMEPLDLRTRKRFASSERRSVVTMSTNEFKHNMQTMQTELKELQRALSSVGHAELVNLVVSRARRQVFGAYGA